MISLLLLILTMTISAIVVKVGAIALEITGLPDEQASFQALSSFSGVGYTTKEAELIANHPQRRKIIQNLIRIGSAGIVTSMATLVGTVVSGKELIKSFMSDQDMSWLPFNSTQLTLLGLVFIFSFTYLLLRSKPISRLVKEIISMILLKQRVVEPGKIEELAVDGAGYAIVRIQISGNNPLIGTSLAKAKLAEDDILVLSIERIDHTLSNPPPSTEIKMGDIVICFGPLSSVRMKCAAPYTLTNDKNLTDNELLPLGIEAPNFTLLDQNGREFCLAKCKGEKSVIIFFYPRDKSFFCSMMVKDYGEKLPQLNKEKIEIVGINPASIESHHDFCNAVGSPVRILSDSNKEVSEKYQVLSLAGLLVDRAVYVVNTEGKIVYAHYGRPPITEIVAAAKRTL